MTLDLEKYIKLITSTRDLALAEELITREESEALQDSLNSKLIKIISGFRRSGKSSLAKLCIQEAVKSKLIRPENILYLNFEDYELTEITDASRLGELYQLYCNSISSGRGHKLLVFDEVQKVKNWDKFIRTLYERNIHNDQIILTGSNSDMLSSELGSNLAGRFIEFKLQPLSFREFLRFKTFDLPKKLSEKAFLNLYTKLEPMFYEYLREGGLPEIYAINNESTKLSFAQNIISKVILDDIVGRFKIRNNIVVGKIFQFISQNPGKSLSYSKIVKYFKQLGIEVHQETVIEYIDYLKQSFAIYQVDKFDYSSKKIFQGSKKFYMVDFGLSHLYKGITNNFSMLLENVVFLKLRRNPNIKNIFYIANGFEIDFVTEDWQGKLALYQVTRELNDDNKERELKGFAHLDKFLEKATKTILVLNGFSKQLEYQGHKIKQINLIQFLLEDLEG